MRVDQPWRDDVPGRIDHLGVHLAERVLDRSDDAVLDEDVPLGKLADAGSIDRTCPPRMRVRWVDMAAPRRSLDEVKGRLAADTPFTPSSSPQIIRRISCDPRGRLLSRASSRAVGSTRRPV